MSSVDIEALTRSAGPDVLRSEIAACGPPIPKPAWRRSRVLSGWPPMGTTSRYNSGVKRRFRSSSSKQYSWRAVERREIQEAEINRFFYLIGIFSGQQDPGNMCLNYLRLPTSHGRSFRLSDKAVYEPQSPTWVSRRVYARPSCEPSSPSTAVMQSPRTSPASPLLIRIECAPIAMQGIALL